MQYELFSEADFRQDTPFTGRSVCLLGVQKSLQQRILALGADIKTSLSRNVHYVVLGKNAPADALESLQQLAFNGFCPRVLNEEELDDILRGHYSPYFVPQNITKNLRLTLRHYLAGRFSYEGSVNPLYTKELYLAPDTSPDLYQQLGNRGIYANAYIDDTTDLIVISDQPLQHLRDGETDTSLSYIEQQYNNSRAQAFRYTMTSEGELTAWLKKK